MPPERGAQTSWQWLDRSCERRARLDLAWRHAGRGAAVVSNSSAAAVEADLAADGIELDLVVARTSPNPALVEPDPCLINRTIRALDTPSRVHAVGDSVSDIIAARKRQHRQYRYANKPGKHRRLSDAGAAIVVDDIRGIAQTAAIAAAVTWAPLAYARRR